MKDSDTPPEELKPYFGKLPEVSRENERKAARIMEIMRIVQATMEENAKKRGSTIQNDPEDTFKWKD
jgi:hypothetical protein